MANSWTMSGIMNGSSIVVFFMSAKNDRNGRNRIVINIFTSFPSFVLFLFLTCLIQSICKRKCFL